MPASPADEQPFRDAEQEPLEVAIEITSRPRALPLELLPQLIRPQWGDHSIWPRLRQPIPIAGGAVTQGTKAFDE